MRGFLLLLRGDVAEHVLGMMQYNVSVPVRGFLLLLLSPLPTSCGPSFVSVPVRGFLLLLLVPYNTDGKARCGYRFSPREGIFAFATLLVLVFPVQETVVAFQSP